MGSPGENQGGAGRGRRWCREVQGGAARCGVAWEGGGEGWVVKKLGWAERHGGALFVRGAGGARSCRKKVRRERGRFRWCCDVRGGAGRSGEVRGGVGGGVE
jgi:hypothetical protein